MRCGELPRDALDNRIGAVDASGVRHVRADEDQHLELHLPTEPPVVINEVINKRHNPSDGN